MSPTALLSVYHKEGIVNFATELVKMGWNILASGGTAKFLSQAGVPVKDVAELVGGGPILGHRVVTLSREVHAGLLAQHGKDDDEMLKLGIPFIDLVCVDLYPLEEEIEKPEATEASVIEKTDIGGPTMLHSGAKGRRILVCNPEDRKSTLDWLRNGMPDKEDTLRMMAYEAESTVAEYIRASADYIFDLTRKE